MSKQEREHRPEAKFSLKEKVRHITGIEGYVVDVALQMNVPVPPTPQNPNGGYTIRNLKEPQYVVAYTNTQGVLLTFQSNEQFLEAV